MGTNAPGKYYLCRLRGRDVAAVGSRRGWGAPLVPAWGTYIWVESADDTVAKVTDAGGRVIMAPFDLLDAARLAVLADPARCSEPGSRESIVAPSSSTSPVRSRSRSANSHTQGQEGPSTSL